MDCKNWFKKQLNHIKLNILFYYYTSKTKMTQNANIDLLIKRIPLDLIINHIIPYSYKPQRKQLLFEIQIFNRQKRKLLQDILSFNCSLPYIISRYCNIWRRADPDNSIFYLVSNIISYFECYKKISDIFSRYFIFWNYTNEEIIFYFTNEFIFLSIDYQLYILWGLLLPFERDDFILHAIHMY